MGTRSDRLRVCFETSRLRDAVELASKLRSLRRGTVQVLPTPFHLLIRRRWNVTLVTEPGAPDLARKWHNDMCDLARQRAGWHFVGVEAVRASAASRHPLVSVLIVDDSAPFRGVARELLTRRGYLVVGEADTAARAAEAAKRLAPQAALVDVNLRDECGFEVSAALTTADPDLAVLLTSSDEPPACEVRVGASGARGFVLKDRLAKTPLEHFWESP